MVYRISSNKRPRRLLNFKTEVRRLLEGGAYFKFRKINNIKRQNLVIFSFKIRMKHKFSLSIKQIYRKNVNINNILIVLLLAY